MYRILPNHFIGRLLIFSLLITLTAFVTRAQSVRYIIEDIPLPDDLDEFVGTSILKDSEGFLWFSSVQGLFRYDGESFRQFTHEMQRDTGMDYTSSGLSSDGTNFLIEDENGIIWFKHGFSLTSFDKETVTFRHFSNPFSGVFKHLILDNDGYLWIACDNGISRFDRESGTFNHFPTIDTLNPGSPRVPVRKLYEDSKGILWVIFVSGDVGVLNEESGAILNMDDMPTSVWDLLEDRSGRFWISTANGLYQYYRETGMSTKQLYLPDDPECLGDQFIHSMIQDPANNFWISTLDGIYLYSKNLEKLEHWVYPAGPEPLREDTYRIVPHNLYLDSSGIIWFFIENGIGKLTKQYNNFTLFKTAAEKDLVTVSDDPDHKIYVTIRSPPNDGLYELDMKTHTQKRLIIDPEFDTVPYSIGGDRFGFTIRDREGNLWVATQKWGLYKGTRDGKGGYYFNQVMINPEDSSTFHNIDVYHLFEDSKGRIWIEARKRHPCYYDPAKGRVMQLVNNPQSTDPLPGDSFRGKAWGSVQGETKSGILLASNKSYGIFAVIPPFIEVSGNLVMASDIIRFRSGSGENLIRGWYMYQSPNDTAGIIWTRGCPLDGAGFQKLILLNPERKHDFTVKSVKYYVKDGLPHQFVSHFVEDDHGNLWLATNGGISKFDPVRETFTNYGTDDGLPAKAFYSCAIRCPDGELLFCTWTGTFVSFYPDRLQFNDQVPPVILTGLEINQQSVSPGDIPGADKPVRYLPELKLHHNQNNIALSYAALDYLQPDKNQYRYLLEGYNNEWIYAGNRTRAEYRNLRPGKYLFRVTGSNSGGVWNEEGTSLQVTIRPPPWRNLWAYMVYALILAGIFRLYRIYLIRKEQIRSAIQIEKMEREKTLEIEKMKSRFFTNISHEFRTPLTLISSPVEDLRRSTSGKVEISQDTLGMIHRNIKRLQFLINQMLDISKMETGKVRLLVSEGDLESFLRTVIPSFLSLAESKKIKYSYELPESGMSLWYDADKMEKILVNLISNAFKFTPEEGEISISCKYIFQNGTEDPEYLYFTIADTGIGIPSDRIDRIFDRFYQVNDSGKSGAEGTGIGLALTREMVDLYRGEIYVESMEGKGTTFNLKLPVAPYLFSNDEKTDLPVDTAEPVLEKHAAEPVAKPGTVKDKVPEQNKPLILIVEDNEDLRKYISGILIDHYRIQTAENGMEGYEMAKESIPDLVISDLMMPVMDGIEMCSMIKEDERTSHIPVIILTARVDQDSRLEGLNARADDYLIKPFDALELQVRVKNLIEQRKKLREKFRKEFFAPESRIPPTERSDHLLAKLFDLIDKKYSDFELNVEDMAGELHMSRTQFFRKVNALTGESPNEILRLYRMKKAAALIKSEKSNVTTIMYEVGFRSTSHFASSFKKYFGLNPSEYRDTLNRS